MTPEQEMPSEQQVRESYMMLESAKAQLEGLAKQQELIQLAVEEHVRARETIKEIAKGAADDEVLVPLGADSYIHAKISDNKDAIVGVGAGISIRRSPEEAEKILDTKIDDLSRAFKSITDKAAKTEAMVQELSEKVQAQYDLLQSGGRA
ncbi:MAG: prefoldin subunit alpha [Thermoplasmata archaeon]|nr:prefoldin subunit alpha [Thermoplasmata archaeon]